MKKNIGILLIIISALNIIAWVDDVSKGKTEGAVYYIFVIALLIVGIALANNNNMNEK